MFIAAKRTPHTLTVTEQHAKSNLAHSTPGFTFTKTNVFVNSPSWSDYV